MNNKRCTNRSLWRSLLLGIAIVMSFTTGPVMGATIGSDPEANKILQSMSSYLGKTKAFGIEADIDVEIVSQNGQKLQLSSYSTILVERPNKFNMTRKGLISDAQFIYDGKNLTIYGKNLNFYTRIEADGAIDSALRAYEFETGLPVPGADLLLSDSYAILTEGVDSSTYIGTAYVNGIECHHLAFREAKVDWQIWVKTGDKPVPMKYIITTKWHTAAPQYQIRFRNWDTSPDIKKDQFSFAIPDGARELDVIPINEIGEFISKEKGKK